MPVPPQGDARPLIVGYGNPMRSDDGLGLRAVQLLAADPRTKSAQVVWQYQLTPEMALDFSRASLVILIDVSVEQSAGEISIHRLEAAPEAEGSAWSHHVEPTQLVELARELYGPAPDVFVVSVGAASLEVGETLSPAVERALPGVVDAVAEIVEQPARDRG